MSSACTPDAALYHGIVIHRRFAPKPHALRYRMFMALIDIDRIDAVAARCRLFSHNRFNLFALHDRDHGGRDPGGRDPGDRDRAAGAGLRRVVDARLAAAGLVADGRVLLLSLPRILGYAFNPLSVYFCHRKDGTLAAILYEVANTFGERHTYAIPVDRDADPALVRQTCEKTFYVSPFLDMEMTYAFRVRPPGERISIAIDGSQGGHRMIAAAFAGAFRPFSDIGLLKAFVAYPLMNVVVVAGIHWEALKLWRKGIGLRPRPAAAVRPIVATPHVERSEGSCP